MNEALTQKSHGIPHTPRIDRIAMSFLCLLGASVACSQQRVEESATKTQSFDTGERSTIEIRVDDGAVEVTGGAYDQVEVIFTTRARASDRTSAQSLLQNARVDAQQEGDTIRVNARSASSSSLRSIGGVTTDVIVRIPPTISELHLDIRTEDGSIEITSVSGTIVAETEDGRIRLSRVSGSTRLRTADGSVTGRELTGELDVRSGDGRIRLDGSFTQLRAVTSDGNISVECGEATTISSDWSLRTSDGSIELSLPRSANAELDVTSGDGEVQNQLSGFQGSQREHRVTGKIGTGGPSILVATMDGRIVLRDS